MKTHQRCLNQLCFGDTIGKLHLTLNLDFESNDKIVKIYSKEFYDAMKEFIEKYEIILKTKQKSIAKKFKSRI